MMNSTFFELIKLLSINIKMNNKLLVALLAAGIVSLASCKTDSAVEKTPQATSGPKKILVLPFKSMPKVYGENTSVRCPVCGKVIMIGRVEEGAEDDLTTKIFDILKVNKDIQLIPPSQAEGISPDMMQQNKMTWSEKDMIIKAGRVLGANAVIFSYVYRYQERVGTQYAVDSPASVAFDIHLVHAEDGSLLWSGHFDETQQSLSENLFSLGTFIKRKARWISAHEMAMTGIEDVMKTFPTP